MGAPPPEPESARPGVSGATKALTIRSSACRVSAATPTIDRSHRGPRLGAPPPPHRRSPDRRGRSCRRLLAEELARLGFSPLRLVDPDVLEVENLVRHPLGAPAVGLPKAPALAAKICREFPPCDAVGLHANFLELADSEQQQLAADADVVVAATDSAACQRHVNQVALAAGRSAVYPAAWVDPRIRDAEVGEILWVRPGRQTPLLPVRGRVPAGGGGHAGGPGRPRRHPAGRPRHSTSRSRPGRARGRARDHPRPAPHRHLPSRADPNLARHPGHVPRPRAGQPQRPRSPPGRALPGVRRPAAGSTAGRSAPAAGDPRAGRGRADHLPGGTGRRACAFLVSREREILISDYRSQAMGYAVDCERGGPAARL